ncbi:fatty acid desaturase 4, chloroplastic-like [Andrographis paniculata]|uniref:fatty acid desaturase 4, chloroplastic-like n=1 Tax=Andrographis paniculata TaxID=175694 RepID=UPI0021E7C850|nr:fatty acid desaturase 4, chloroplastic-like [Andrographis paniculata]
MAATVSLPQRPSLFTLHSRAAVFAPRRVCCSAAAPPPLLKAASATRPPAIANPTDMKSTWAHRAWLTSGCAAVILSLARSAAGAAASHIWLEPIMAGAAGYVLADLGSGIYHWGIDNYGSANTPVFGAQIDAFQGHHKWPWTITRRQFANNLHALGKAVTFAVVPINLATDEPVWLGFVAVFSGCIMFSQQFHAWAHTTRSRLPPAVAALQNAGVLVSPSQHAAHHREPYNNNYCIVSGVWNEVLDNSRFLEIVEMIIFFRFGVRPRSWTSPQPGWIQDNTCNLLS